MTNFINAELPIRNCNTADTANPELQLQNIYVLNISTLWLFNIAMENPL